MAKRECSLHSCSFALKLVSEPATNITNDKMWEDALMRAGSFCYRVHVATERVALLYIQADVPWVRSVLYKEANFRNILHLSAVRLSTLVHLPFNFWPLTCFCRSSIPFPLFELLSNEFKTHGDLKLLLDPRILVRDVGLILRAWITVT